jgi:hypothetical protein
VSSFEFESGKFRWFYLYLCSYRELCLLVSWCAGHMCDMMGNDEDRGRTGDG